MQVAAVVTAEDLALRQRETGNILVLQGSINPPGVAAFHKERIPGARLFEVGVCSNRESPLAFTIPSEEAFQHYVRQLGIKKSSHVIIYDAAAPFAAAPRVWWMFRLFGHVRVSVLSGGLALWKEEGHSVEAIAVQEQSADTFPSSDDDFVASMNFNLLKRMADVTHNIENKQFQLVDGRPKDAHEAGSIPQTKNLPFGGVFDEKKRFKAKENLEELFRDADIDLQAPLVVHCRTGVTACSVALAAFICGKRDVAVYDGSWNEWSASHS